MRRVLFAMLGIVLLGGALIAGGALVYAQRGGLGKIYTDGQSIRAEADAAPLRSILWRDPTPFGLPVDLRGASELQISASGDLVVFVRTDPHER
ncbi:MAG: hypothetical protein KDA20_10860, partial [Phycisphaerales bacterium]|nr:hypothetical protein [Phycisphaerales bacterium]